MKNYTKYNNPVLNRVKSRPSTHIFTDAELEEMLKKAKTEIKRQVEKSK